MSNRTSFLCAYLLVVCGSSALAEAVPPLPATNVINACVSKFDGYVRIVKNKKECFSEWESFVEWNQQGVAGATGASGPAGLQGMQGFPGLTGAMGSPGSPGPQGLPGLIGPAGANGLPGTPGVAGPAGANGAPGLAGPQGIAGLPGPAGIAGATGAAGIAGPQGIQGLPGLAGAAGAPGPKGDSGNAGPAGPSGPTGPVGPQGPAGTSGGGTIPANLTALSGQISTNGVAFLGATRFRYEADCQLGDVVLSVNGYGSGALPADGRLLPINTYTAVFSIVGTNFGGDGTTNFALPDLRAFAPKGLQYSMCVQGIFPAQN